MRCFRWKIYGGFVLNSDKNVKQVRAGFLSPAHINIALNQKLFSFFSNIFDSVSFFTWNLRFSRRFLSIAFDENKFSRSRRIRKAYKKFRKTRYKDSRKICFSIIYRTLIQEYFESSAGSWPANGKCLFCNKNLLSSVFDRRQINL